MTELNLIDSLLTALTGHGPVTVGLVALLGSLGVPVIPAPLLVLAAGALARQGLIDLSTVLFLGLLGALLGDSTGYALGRVARGWVQRRWGGHQPGPGRRIASIRAGPTPSISPGFCSPRWLFPPISSLAAAVILCDDSLPTIWPAACPGCWATPGWDMLLGFNGRSSARLLGIIVAGSLERSFWGSESIS
jgi:hypothetical protein